jgi:DNA-binding response OmpR family regulator
MKKVMLIEDDPTMITLLGTLLEMEGFQVVKVQRFGSVVEDITREMPDAILMDVHLTDLDGLTFLAEIRQTEGIKDIKVIMSSGMDKQYESEQAGADAFLLKPYMPDELITKITNLLG